MKIRLIIIVFALLAFLTASVGGYFYYHSMIGSAITELNNDANTRINDLANRITLYFEGHKRMAAALAGVEEVRKLMGNRQPGALAAANAVLDHFQKSLDVNACYLIDPSGLTIASSNRRSPESFVGNNFAFRPYFKQAMEGKPAVYLALGTITGKRGVFYSYPVYTRGRTTPSGVVVIKTSIDYLDRELNNQYDGAMVLSDPQGVIFVSNHADWLFHVLWKLPSKTLSEITDSRQFGQGPFPWLGWVPKSGNYAADASGKRYRIHRGAIDSLPGWEVIYAQDHELGVTKESGIVFRKLGFGILLVCIVIGFASIILYRIATREIAKRITVEEEFRSISHRFQAMINASPLPITIVDAEGTASLWNPAAEQVFGWTGQEVIGKFLPIIPADRCDEFMEILGSIFKGNALKSVGTQRMRKDGALIDVALSAAPVHNAEGVITTAMLIYEDITERRKAEEERLKGHMLESIGILAGGIAHDFNNLLTVILGNITVAKMCVQPGDKAFGRLDDAENVCEMAAELSKRLITFATGGDPIKRPASLPRLLRSAVAAALKDTAIYAEYHLPDDLSLAAIDEGQMKQVFVNLVINAREAMPGGGTLTVHGENLHISAQDTFPMREGDYVKIAISDTGSGIPAESLAKIFDPYYSTKDTYSQKGLGLGLAVCYSIIKKHAGLITAESQVGVGTTFTIYLNAVRNG